MSSSVLDKKPLHCENGAKQGTAESDFESFPVEFISPATGERRVYWGVKRLFDIVFSVAALLCLSPVLLLLSVLIYLDDPHGSPIYTQTRVGRNGKCFRLYKFRTMIVGADQLLESLQQVNEADGPAFKIKDDPRITRIGGFLRQCSIDELPQLWNVLQGDMSLVGPRPALPGEVEQYTEYQMQRLAVVPGLTCYWQTQPRRNDIPFEQWIELDLQYIRECNFRIDLKLIFKTVSVMFRREGR